MDQVFFPLREDESGEKRKGAISACSTTLPYSLDVNKANQKRNFRFIATIIVAVEYKCLPSVMARLCVEPSKFSVDKTKIHCVTSPRRAIYLMKAS